MMVLHVEAVISLSILKYRKKSINVAYQSLQGWCQWVIVIIFTHFRSLTDTIRSWTNQTIKLKAIN
jgi:hypothetical protein